MRITSLRPHVLEWQDYRAAKLVAVAGASATVRVRVFAGAIRNKTVATSSLPTTAIGAPLAARISNDNPDACTVVEVQGAHWGGDAPRDDAADIANDGRWPVIPRDITGAPLHWWTS